jgi:ketosteroid isomerase-like protein
MKNAGRLLIIGLVFLFFSQAQIQAAAADPNNRSNPLAEEIWALEAAYFSNLYQANYEGVLALVHSQFLGWPGAAPQPLDKETSARFMKQLIPKPTTHTVKIERAGIRLQGEVALTQYLLHVTSLDPAGAPKTQSSRITHTWVKEGVAWKLLGGMSCDK